MIKSWHLVFLGAVFAMLFGLVGSFDYQDAEDSAQIYCTMVQEGTWPDYDKAIDCIYQEAEKQ